jgi:hypothetical protein
MWCEETTLENSVIEKDGWMDERRKNVQLLTVYLVFNIIILLISPHSLLMVSLFSEVKATVC